MRVEVVIAWPRRHRAARLELADGSTLIQAVEASGLAMAGEVSGYAVFGVNAQPSQLLREGDRVELLRPLLADPKDARRKRASKGAR